MKLTIVYNPKSGSSMNKQDILDLCKKHGVSVQRLIAISPQLKKDLASIVRSGGHIAAIGGDGTVSAVAGIIAGTSAVLIPLPGGTLNNFTKTLDIPQDVDEALGRALQSKPRRIDIASVNGMYFINNSSVGLYPRALRHREQLESVMGKWPAAAVGLYRALFRFRLYQISINGQDLTTSFVFVGNNDYKLEQSPQAVRDRLDGGVLSIYVVKSSRRIDLLKIFIASLMRRLDVVESFDYYKTKKLVIATKKVRTISVSHDGEVTKVATPLTYQIHAKTLNVLF